jgi:hypothetical protein
MASTFGVADSVRLLVEPGSLTEVRALLSSSGERICRNQYYFGHQADALARDVHALDQLSDCVGIYLIPNPITKDLISKNTTWRKPFITKIPSSNQSNMLRRRWILVDCDSIRPGECSATDAERTAAFELADNVIATLSMLGFANPVKADSGNGCHLLYPVDMPPDQQSSMKIKELLNQLLVRVRVLGAKVDPVTFDAQRMVRLYGTKSRKGESTPERPWRMSGIVDSGDPGAGVKNTAALENALSVWREQDELIQSDGRRDPIDSARKYLAKVEGAVSQAGGHNKTFRAAMLLVEGFGLSDSDSLRLLQEWNSKCKPEWSERELSHKIESARSKCDSSKIGHLLSKPNASLKVSEEKTGLTKSDATVADLIRLGQSMQWLWKGWMQRGVIVGIAAEPGAGKTRTCADIAKRIYHGLPWPDGSPPTLDKGSKVLWLACDGQWGEIAQFPETFGIPPDAIFLNSWNLDPTEGTVLDEAKHFKELEDRINRTGVALVFVDTVMNSTTHNTMRPEDGIKFFKPLAEVAQRTNTTIVLVTHLSVGGEALGRRIVGQCRQMISLTKIEGEPISSPKRKLFISKSNSVFPPELEMTLQENGNSYIVTGQTQQANTPKKKMTEMGWLEIYLKSGAKPEELLLADAEAYGFERHMISKIIFIICVFSTIDSYNWVSLSQKG